MQKELFTANNKIKLLREKLGITQSELAKRLGLTRSSVNGWEMGLSVPSTPLIVELAKLFNVSSDYLLGLEHDKSLDVTGLSDKEVAILSELAEHFRNKD